MTRLRLIFPLALFWVLGTSIQPGLGADAPIGGVVKTKPDAFGTPPKGERITLRESDRVVRDQTVETSSTGYLHLRFIDRSDLWLDADSALVLDELVFDRANNAGEYAVELSTGLFRVITGALPHGSYELRTPTAIIGVRGTDFTVQVLKNGTTRVSVYAGVVTVQPRLGGKPREVRPPETASISRAGGPVLVSRSATRVPPPAGSADEWPLPVVSAEQFDDGGRNVGAGGSASSGGSSGSGGGGTSGGSSGGSSGGTAGGP